MMVASLKIAGVVWVWRLAHGSATKLASPNHQCVFQHATLLQVLDQRATGLVNIEAGLFEVGQ